MAHGEHIHSEQLYLKEVLQMSGGKRGKRVLISYCIDCGKKISEVELED